MVSEGAAPHRALWGAAYAAERRLLGMEPVHGIGGGAAAGQRERPLPPGSAPSLWLQVADTGCGVRAGRGLGLPLAEVL